LFEGFERGCVATSGAEINYARAGTGPPVLLLHGYPQSLTMWHAVAPRLAEDFTVVAADLRGYGDSSKPEGDEEHLRYSKREMARDMVEVMSHLGFESFALVGHDRGGRVGHRLALDHPKRVTRLVTLDIVPTREVFARADTALAMSYYHWFFLAQRRDFPERLIGGAPDYYLRQTLSRYGTVDDTFTPEAFAEYQRCFDPATIHASCEDYRAAASVDREHDEADLGKKKISCPLLVLWGANGVVDKLYDVLEVWRPYAEHEVTGRALDAGHYLAEERPGETLAELLPFLDAG
jgi:haloacetate dehalogenase